MSTLRLISAVCRKFVRLCPGSMTTTLPRSEPSGFLSSAVVEETVGGALARGLAAAVVAPPSAPPRPPRARRRAAAGRPPPPRVPHPPEQRARHEHGESEGQRAAPGAAGLG